jgi:arsenical pump membrane protein
MMINTAIWIISFLSIAGVIIRPFKLNEVIWAVTGAILLLILGLISPADGLTGISKGTDVYFFLVGMMLLAETAREERFFDWLAAHAAKLAKGLALRLFLLVCLVGIVVTAFLSNDATAVVLTPAVAAAVKAADVKKPLPYLLICAFIANAASFILPISNPANLVIYGSHLPPLLEWLRLYGLPSIVAVIATCLSLYYTQRKDLKGNVQTSIDVPSLSSGGKTAIAGIIGTAVVLLIASAWNMPLGLPTAVTGILTSAVVLIGAKKSPVTVIRGISWAVLPLVAGLFVIVEALNKTGLTQALSMILQRNAEHAAGLTAWGAGVISAFTCNLVNNLPLGLIAGQSVQTGHIPAMVKSAVLIGVDLGPNLSVTGSLATILWLVALRREGINVSGWAFLKLGFIIMTAALLFALAALWI